MILTISIFLFSLLGIVGLFTLKEWETRRGRIVAPALREKSDTLAFRLKELYLALLVDMEKLPPEVLHFLRIIIHEIALFAAAFLRFLASQAHRLADFVSHKHAFQRRPPRSEFLKKVLEHKNGESDGEERVDARSQNRHNVLTPP